MNCSVLQGVAGCCRVLKWLCSQKLWYVECRARLWVAACCSVLQCVAGCCSGSVVRNNSTLNVEFVYGEFLHVYRVDSSLFNLVCTMTVELKIEK